MTQLATSRSPFEEPPPDNPRAVPDRHPYDPPLPEDLPDPDPDSSTPQPSGPGALPQEKELPS